MQPSTRDAWTFNISRDMSKPADTKDKQTTDLCESERLHLMLLEFLVVLILLCTPTTRMTLFKYQVQNQDARLSFGMNWSFYHSENQFRKLMIRTKS